jgi:hypothetical protein
VCQLVAGVSCRDEGVADVPIEAWEAFGLPRAQRTELHLDDLFRDLDGRTGLASGVADAFHERDP